MAVLQEPSSITEIAGAPNGGEGERSLLSGWLILPSIGLVLGPLIGLEHILEARTALDANALLTTEMKDYLSFAIWSGKAFLAFQIFVALLFFFRSKLAPMAMVAMFTLNVIVVGLSSVKANAVNSAYDPLFACLPAFIVAGIWIPYFLQSTRVKQTFVR